jgi:hypothetical protein
MKTFFPQTGSEAEWNAAYYRMEDYLRALNVTNKVHQSQIILRLLETAASKHARDPEQSPTTLALAEAHAAMDRWFEMVLQRADRSSAVGLLLLFITDASNKWPLVFLSENIPTEFQQALVESDVRAGPDLQVSSMVPRPLDISPLAEVVLQDRWERLETRAVVRGLVVVGVIIVLFFLFIIH